MKEQEKDVYNIIIKKTIDLYLTLLSFEKVYWNNRKKLCKVLE